MKYLKSACFKLCILLIFTLCSSQSVFAAGIEYINVEGKGSGETRAQAISEALIEAISKVNGVSLASQDVSALKVELSSLEATKGDTSVNLDTASIEEAKVKHITSATKGLVQSYDVLSEEASMLKPGWVDVTVQATVGRYQASEQTLRKRIAVMPFKLKPDAAKYEKRYAELAAQGVVDYLAQTRRFAVLDRDFLKEKHAEFDLLRGDDIPPAEKARVGNTLGTDFLIVGAIDELNADLQKETIPYVNEIQLTHKVKVRMTWRIIEAPTGMIMLSDTISEAQSKKIMQNTALDDLPGVASLADVTAERIGKQIMATIYPPMVVAYSGTSLTIGQGGDTLKVGDRFNLIKYGEMLKDPYTQEPLAREEKPVGLVEVSSVLPKTSEAQIIETTITPEQFKPGQFILREAKKVAPAKKAPAKTMQPKW